MGQHAHAAGRMQNSRDMANFEFAIQSKQQPTLFTEATNSSGDRATCQIQIRRKFTKEVFFYLELNSFMYPRHLMLFNLIKIIKLRLCVKNMFY